MFELEGYSFLAYLLRKLSPFKEDKYDLKKFLTPAEQDRLRQKYSELPTSRLRGLLSEPGLYEEALRLVSEELALRGEDFSA